MDDNVKIVTEVDSPKLLKKVLRNKKAAAAATLVVAIGGTLLAAKFLKDNVDVDVVTSDATA